MFVKPYIKHNRTTGERYTVYKLVEGCRVNGQVTYRIIVSFGRLDELDTDDRKKLLGRRVEQLIVNGGNTLSISQADGQAEELARYYYEEVKKKRRYDIKQGKADCKTPEGIVNALSTQTSFSHRKPIVVIDAGIATDDNLQMLQDKGFEYMCVSRSSLKEYYADTTATPVKITDKRKQPIELLKVQVNGQNDQYLWVRSQAKKMKEDSMNGHRHKLQP